MAEELLRRLARIAAASHATVYIVGGYLRDRLLGREPVDLDLLVEGPPAPFLHALSREAGFEPVVFSRKEPITYRIAMGDWLIDVSACRAGGLREALGRRDFTINAMAAPLSGDEAAVALDSPIDPLGGLADLRARRIRHISSEGLDEDPVRLLRAVRLAVALDGFSLDPGLRPEITRRAHLIAGCPAERVLAEMEVILASNRAGGGLRMMEGLGLLFQVVPELARLGGLRQNRWHRYDALEHTLRCVEEADALQGGHPGIRIEAPLGVEDSEILKWAALWHDAGKAQTAHTGEDGEVHFYGHETLSALLAQEALTRLRLSGRKVERAAKLIRNHLRLTLLAAGHEVSDKALRRLVHQMGYDTPVLCLLAVADRRAGGGPEFETRMRDLERVAARVMGVMLLEGERVISPPPLLTGDEVMRILGIEPGPRVGTVMRWLTRLQVEEKLTRQDQAVALLKSLPPSRLLTLDDEP
ncbi:MAG TPA: HD domain-containing protein [Candidatus Polarisedimenticolia bacterium]